MPGKQWILEQESGYFLACVVDTSGYAGHVVGTSGKHRAILDNESAGVLPLEQEGLDACCEGALTCVGIDDVRELVMVPQSSKKASRKRKRCEKH